MKTKNPVGKGKEKEFSRAFKRQMRLVVKAIKSQEHRKETRRDLRKIPENNELAIHFINKHLKKFRITHPLVSAARTRGLGTAAKAGRKR